MDYTDSATEGRFVDSNGHHYSSQGTAWSRNQPDSASNNEDCVILGAIAAGDYAVGFYDAGCDRSFPVVCQKSGEPSALGINFGKHLVIRPFTVTLNRNDVAYDLGYFLNFSEREAQALREPASLAPHIIQDFFPDWLCWLDPKRMGGMVCGKLER